jgi:phospholipase C
VKRHHVNHTQYDTTSILRFITRRYHLPKLSGMVERDEAVKVNGRRPMGDLTEARRLSRR